MNWTPTSFSVALTLATGTALQNDWAFNSQGIKLLAQNKMTETPEDYLPEKESFFRCILLCFSSGRQRWRLGKAQAFAASLIPVSLGKKAAGCPQSHLGSTVAVSLSTKPQPRVINRAGTWTPPSSTSRLVLSKNRCGVRSAQPARGCESRFAKPCTYVSVLPGWNDNGQRPPTQSCQSGVFLFIYSLLDNLV